jgi:hypothetical protein
MQQEAITIKLDQPRREISIGALVVIAITEDAVGIDAWSCPSRYTAEEKIAFLHFIYSCICANLFIQAKEACASVEISKPYVRALQWLIFELKSIKGYDDAVISINMHLESLKTSLLRNMFTGDSVTVDEVQEELVAVSKLFEAWRDESEAVEVEVGRGDGEQGIYFLKVEEIKVDRLRWLSNRDGLCQALELASSYDLVDIEVGFFEETLAASVVRGRRDPEAARREAAEQLRVLGRSTLN